MGNCVAARITTSGAGKGAAAGRGAGVRGPTAKVVHMGDGRAREYMAGTAKAGHVEADNPGYCLCSSEALHVGQRPPRAAEAEYLQPGQVYFLLPLGSLANPLTLQDLCELAAGASAALRRLPPSATAGRGAKNRPERARALCTIGGW